MTRLALGLAYDGRPFQGWQTQPGGNTVQDTLERALEVFLGQPVSAVCAGRTDTGVHAAMQVVHLDAPVDRVEMAWVRGLSAHLPESVSVRWARPVSDDFHARFSARSRRYVYLLLVDRVQSPHWVGRAGWSFRSLDVEAMQLAATHLLGTHDFSSFRAAGCQARSPVRTVSELTLQQRGRLIMISIQANAFLHHMVRNIVGALVWVGQGRVPPDWMAEIRDERDRRKAAPTFSPDGLYFTAVAYPDFPDLPSDATQEVLIAG